MMFCGILDASATSKLTLRGTIPRLATLTLSLDRALAEEARKHRFADSVPHLDDTTGRDGQHHDLKEDQDHVNRVFLFDQ